MWDIIYTSFAVIGFAVSSISALAGLSFICYVLINYFYDKYVDVKALVQVLKEAKRQGRNIYKEKKE